MKLIAALVTTLICALSAYAEPSGSEDGFLAVFVAVLEKCERDFPNAAADYAQVRMGFERWGEAEPRLKPSMESALFHKTLREARNEIDKVFSSMNKSAVCTQMRQGKFGLVEMPPCALTAGSCPTR